MIWYVGKPYEEFLEYLDKKGIAYGLFEDPLRPYKKRPDAPIVPIDFSSPKTILDSLKNISRADIQGVVAIYENYVWAAAIIADFYGLAGLSPESALACTDKDLMRQRFLSYDPSISPDFAVVDSWESAEAFAKKHGFPVMLKPANLRKSLLVTKSDSAEELKQSFTAAAETIEALYGKYKVRRKPKLIIEEFLAGSMHAVEAFADSDGTPHVLDKITDCYTGYDAGRQGNYLFSRILPSRLSAAEQTIIKDVAAKGMRALGMKSSPAHVEIILTANGPKLVEIAGRIGGYRAKMHEQANGIDVFGAMVDTALGRQPQLTATTSRRCAVIELFPDKNGKFAGITNEVDVKRLPTLFYLHTRPKLGSRIGLASAGYKAAATIMLLSDDDMQFKHDYDFIKKNVTVKIS